MRTTTSAQDTALAAKERRVAFRLRTKNASGTWKTLTELGQDDLDFLDGVRIGETIDQPVPFGEFKLHKYHFGTGENLAPLDEDSSLNVDDGGSYAALLDAGREIDFAIATVAHGTEPTSGDYETVFHGEVDTVAWPDETVNIVSRDYLASHLWDRWIEEPTTYGGTQDVETVMQDILTAETDGRVTLWVPTSPGLSVPDREMGPMRVYDALIQLAQMTGWALRIVWRESASEFQLKFFEPDRSASTTDWDFSTDDYFVVRKAEISRENIRNAIDVKYTEANGSRSGVGTTDATSIARFGRRWMGIFLGADDPIDTGTEASTLRDAALADLKDPDFDFVVKADLFWPVELDDYYGFTANNDGDERWFSTDQALGLYGYTHEIAMDRALTTLQTRGQPAGHYLRWNPWSEDSDIPAPVQVRPTVAQEVSQSGSTGSLDLTIDDPDKLVTAVQFAEKSDAGSFGSLASTWDRSTGTIGSSQTIERGEDVSLAGKHNVSVRWVVTCVDDEGSYTIEGAYTFDVDEVAEILSASVSFDANGHVDVTAEGDDDVANIYVTVGEDSAPSDPTAGANDGSEASGAGLIETTQSVGMGNEAVVKAVGANSNGSLGPVRTFRKRRGDAASNAPTVAQQVSQSGSTGSLDLTIADPTLAVTAVQFAKKTDAGSYGSLASTWDRSTGTPGTNPTLTRGEDVTLASKHTASIRWVVTYTDPDGSSQTVEAAHSFDADLIAEVSGFDAWINDSGEVVVSPSGDEDTANMYVTVGDGSAPSDPTAGANDGNISGRSGTVNTGVTPTVGNTVHIKVVGADSGGTLGPVKSDQIVYNAESPVTTLTADNVRAENNLIAEGGLGQDLILLTGTANGGRAFWRNASGNDRGDIQVDASGNIVFTTLNDMELSPGGDLIPSLPTADPGVTGALWNDNGTVKVS